MTPDRQRTCRHTGLVTAGSGALALVNDMSSWSHLTSRTVRRLQALLLTVVTATQVTCTRNTVQYYHPHIGEIGF